MKTKISMAIIVGTLIGLAASAATPYSLLPNLSTWRQWKVAVPVAAGAWTWTNTFQAAGVVQTEFVGIQCGIGTNYTTVNGTNTTTNIVAAAQNATTNATMQVVTWPTITAWTNFIPAITVTNGYGTATNTEFIFYGDVFSGTGAGTNTVGGTTLITIFTPN